MKIKDNQWWVPRFVGVFFVLSFFFLSLCLDTLDCKICRGVLLFLDARRRWVSAKMGSNFSTLEKKEQGKIGLKFRRLCSFYALPLFLLTFAFVYPLKIWAVWKLFYTNPKISLWFSWLPTPWPLNIQVQKYKYTSQFPRTFFRPSLTLNSFRVGQKKNVTLKTEGLGNETRLLIKTEFQ